MERRQTAPSASWHLTQRLVELGHLGMVPACRLGLVAGEGQKETEGSGDFYRVGTSSEQC